MTQQHRQYLSGLKKERILLLISRFSIAFLIIGLWELTARLGIIDSFIFSSPTRIIKCFKTLLPDGYLPKQIGVTLLETLLSFSIVITLSMFFAIIMWRFKIIYKILEPYLILLNSLPKSALAPLLIVWLGNNMKTIIVAAVSVAVFGAMMSIYTGFSEIDPDKIKLIRTFGGQQRHILFKLIIPSSVPTIINTIKVNLGLSLVGVIIGEFLAAKQGLGYLIIYGSQVFKMDLVLLSIVILCIISIILYLVINIIEKNILKSGN